MRKERVFLSIYIEGLYIGDLNPFIMLLGLSCVLSYYLGLKLGYNVGLIMLLLLLLDKLGVYPDYLGR